MKFRITVEIDVDVPENGEMGKNPNQWAEMIANDYKDMALKYRSIGAEKARVAFVIPVERNKNDS